jgi:hypothetical protein
LGFDYSQICGYEKCKAICNPDIDDKSIKIDDSTFDSKFISDDIEYIKDM